MWFTKCDFVKNWLLKFDFCEKFDFEKAFFLHNVKNVDFDKNTILKKMNFLKYVI